MTYAGWGSSGIMFIMPVIIFRNCGISLYGSFAKAELMWTNRVPK